MNESADDEVTSDVDPAWIAAIRAQVTEERRRDSSDDAIDEHPEPSEVGDDWLEGEPPWDPEATVGASDGLIERIRGELRTTASPTPPPVAPIMQPIDDAGTTPDSADFPTATSASTTTSQSTTVRWEPTQRLVTAAPVQATPTLPVGPHLPGLDRTKVTIATIIAIALVLTVWLVVRGNDGGGEPAPTGSVPVSAERGSPIPGSAVLNSVANATASTVLTSEGDG